MMRKTSVAAILTMAALSAPVAMADDAKDAGPLALSNFNADLYFTNQYMFRGISNSDGPAVQGDVNWVYNGWYLTAWGSNTRFSDEDIEIDAYGGYRWSWSGFNFDVGGLYYTYPGDSCHTTKLTDGSGADAGLTFDNTKTPPKALCPDTDYGEFQGIVNYAFSDAFLAPSVTLKYDYSPDFYGSDGDAHAVEGDLALTFPTGPFGWGNMGFIASVGYQTVSGDESSGKKTCVPFIEGSGGSQSAACDAALGNTPGTKYQDGYDYTWWRIGVNKNIDGFLFDLSYYDTDHTNSLKNFYFSNRAADTSPRQLIASHVVFTVSRNFTFP